MWDYVCIYSTCIYIIWSDGLFSSQRWTSWCWGKVNLDGIRRHTHTNEEISTNDNNCHQSDGTGREMGIFVCCIHFAEAVRVSDIKLRAGESLWVSEDWQIHQETALSALHWNRAEECDCVWPGSEMLCLALHYRLWLVPVCPQNKKALLITDETLWFSVCRFRRRHRAENFLW